MEIQSKESASTLSNDITILTAEINSYKQIAGQAIFEIGLRLKKVKEEKLSEIWGGWTKYCDDIIKVPVRHANKFILIEERLGEKWSTSTTIGFEVLYQLATLSPEERERPHTIPSTGETKSVDEMTVRELREVKRALRAEKESRELAERQRDEALESAQRQHLSRHGEAV
ncbi:hypothetical protein C2W64_01910 [Brevibacillus laterosporus]|nr:DNA modification methylase [Brevibacillus laterosporus]RAP30714.1 hypothetical protein C2W64_01910 [Brevibacillus laterosporus]